MWEKVAVPVFSNMSSPSVGAAAGSNKKLAIKIIFLCSIVSMVNESWNRTFENYGLPRVIVELLSFWVAILRFAAHNLIDLLCCLTMLIPG